MTHIVAILLALAGFTLLALSMGRHQPDMVGHKLTRSASLRVRSGGYALLALVFLIDLMAFGAVGVLAGFGHLSLGAWGIVAWLCARANRRAG